MTLNDPHQIVKFQPSFWKNKRVLVTGHTGFMGSWLCQWLNSLQAEVHGIALAPETNPSLYLEAKIKLGGSDSFIDIRNRELTASKIQEINPEFIIHLAAQPLVLPSYSDPVGTFATNVMGTAHVLEAASKLKKLQAIAVITSDKCYKNEEQHRAFSEQDPMGGDDPYSASKGATEILVSSFRKSFFKEIPVLCFRAGNIVGGGDWSYARLIPDIMRSLNQKQKVTIRSPKAVRPWQHVLEPLYVYLWLLQCSVNSPAKWSDAWNIGPDESSEKTVLDVTRLAYKAWDRNPDFEIVESKLHEAHFLKITSQKLRAKTGWSPVLNFEETIAWTGQWYKNYYENPNQAAILCAQQIKDFYQRIEAREKI